MTSSDNTEHGMRGNVTSRWMRICSPRLESTESS